MDDCIFCKLIKGELPSYRVYEDEDIFAFLDINPTRHGHVLVIPKQHFANIEETPEDVLSKLIIVVKKIGKAIKENLPAQSYNVIVNNDKAAGQIIPHIHWHIIPRNEGDGLKPWPQEPYPEGEADKVLEKIKIN